MKTDPQHHWRYEKILSVEQAKSVAAKLREAERMIVTTNGAFDILHAGHLDALEEAKQQGDILFVGLNSDASVKGGKGPDRPYIPEAERAAVLAALACVDYVVIVDQPYDDVAQFFVRAIHPHVHANLSDYGKPEEWLEWPAMQEVGAKPHIVERREGLATSDIIKKIRLNG